MELFAALALLLGAGGAAVAAQRVQRQLDDAGGLLLRVENRVAELKRIEQGRLDADDVQKIAEVSVEGGTRTVQLVHHGIAAIPFGILEAIPPTRPVTKIVHVAHDLIANSVYGTISLANRGLGRLWRRRKPSDPGDPG